MIGSPTYGLESCEIPCDEGSVTFTSSGVKRMVHFNGDAMSGIPADAIAYEVKLTGSGIRNGISSARVENLDREFSFTLRSMFWEQDNLVSMKLPVESMWTADLQSQKAFTLTPVLNVYYVYPVYDRKVQPY